ncbi:MAG: helicase-related protein, partial [Bosea sp. (in: a-proteobacteria)]
AIHGNKSQGQRERALGAFRDGELRILVATDIAARGIDVDGISHVVNFDLPNVSETYVHRIGRTARAGASGVAIAFCTPEERGDLAAIEKLTRVAITPVGEVPYWDGRTPKKPPQNQGRGGRGQQGGGREGGSGRDHGRPSGQRQGAKPAGGASRSEAPRSERPARSEQPVQRKEAAPAKEGLGGVAFLQQRTDQRRTNGARRRAT